ncbi:MAG: hypothetical protein J5626_01495 [Lachnospiraceae bacterium]|nr:hypothetical protein [Lachnospiraceae bacterium]
MEPYVLLDAGMGGGVVIFGGVAVLVFIIAAFLIIRASIRLIIREIRGYKEPSNPELERENKEAGETTDGYDSGSFWKKHEE